MIIVIYYCISDVEASNMISSVKTTLDINVLRPVPKNLTVAVVTERDELPWCHPDASSEHHVYSNNPVEFEAELPVSGNLTFSWKVVENSTGETADETTVAGVACYHGQSCTSSVQVRACVLCLGWLLEFGKFGCHGRRHHIIACTSWFEHRGMKSKDAQSFLEHCGSFVRCP